MKSGNLVTLLIETTLSVALLLVGPAAVAQRSVVQAKTARAHRVVLVSIPDRQLAVLEDGIVLRTFPVSVGAANSPSPIGEFHIVNRIVHPNYSHDGTVIPAGPYKPLGPRWMGLSLKGYGIHGTDQPKSIGKAASHGCIRLSNHDIIELFRLVSVGDMVEIRAERDQEIGNIFGTQDQTTIAETHVIRISNQSSTR